MQAALSAAGRRPASDKFTSVSNEDCRYVSSYVVRLQRLAFSRVPNFVALRDETRD